MRINFKYLGILLVFTVTSLAHAGSYEDFFAAVKRDNAGNLQSLLNRGFDPNTVDPGGLSGLYLALRDENLKAANVLLEWPRTNIDIRTPEDESPLMIAALKGRLDFVKRLLARGADVNKTGWTPLHYAASGGHRDIMQLLLDHHAYIDAESPNGTTPLMMAAGYSSDAAVKLLLDAGADPSLKNQLGLSALDFAERADREDSTELIIAALRSWKAKYR
jgi:ankyrin repeat protein